MDYQKLTTVSSTFNQVFKDVNVSEQPDKDIKKQIRKLERDLKKFDVIMDQA